jgi:hypothetical protein
MAQLNHLSGREKSALALPIDLVVNENNNNAKGNLTKRVEVTA